VIDDSLPCARRRRPAAAAGDASPPEAGDEDLIDVTIPSRPDRLRLVRQMVSLAAGLCGCDAGFAGDLVLAVDEACQNVIRHAYKNNRNGRITVSTRREGDNFVVLIRDYADPIDVSAVRPRDLEDIRPGGLGTHLMRELLDRIEFMPTPPDGGNLLKLTKRIRCEARNEA
jgi:anti-sigma regulatory factor (Ser/Thr protein kinase)